jgi:hypothetical protein
MNDYDFTESCRFEAFFRTPSGQASSEIVNAIEKAATTPIGVPPVDATAWPQRINAGVQDYDAPASRGIRLPPVPDDILLGILPVSRVSSDVLGRAQIEPDGPSLNAWSRTDRAAAEHLVSWVNESGTARDAIEKAITGGSNRFERLSIEYDDHLARVGYDRSAPDLQARDNELRGLHDSIQHAKDILADLRVR